MVERKKERLTVVVSITDEEMGCEGGCVVVVHDDFEVVVAEKTARREKKREN
jgi:hypothetical protein